MKVVSTETLPTIDSVNRFIRISKLKQKDIINIYRVSDFSYVIFFGNLRIQISGGHYA